MTVERDLDFAVEVLDAFDDTEPELDDSLDELDGASSIADADEVLTGAQRLSEDQIEEIAALLRAGRRLPPHLFPNLFEAPREYQLAYRGKARRADILADTMAVPLQAV